MSRDEYFAGLFFLGCANGLASRIIEIVLAVGWTNAIISTFETSAIVWISCYLGLALILGTKDDEITRLDVIVGSLLLVPIALPIGGLSWLAITLLGLYAVLFTNPPSSRRRGAIILIAVTVPMLWSRVLFRYFADIILQIDAWLVSLLLRTPRSANMVRFVDDSGSLVILPYCSSLHNVSLAILSWVAINQWLDRRWSPGDLHWVILAAMAVVSINVTRMGLMGLSQNHYQIIHSAWGDTITNLLILSAIVGICLVGVRRELFGRV